MKTLAFILVSVMALAACEPAPKGGQRTIAKWCENNPNCVCGTPSCRDQAGNF